MLDVCSTFGKEYDVLFNPVKIVCMCISGYSKIEYVGNWYLNGKVLQRKDSVKYLGTYVYSKMCDEEDIK